MRVFKKGTQISPQSDCWNDVVMAREVSIWYSYSVHSSTPIAPSKLTLTHNTFSVRFTYLNFIRYFEENVCVCVERDERDGKMWWWKKAQLPCRLEKLARSHFHFHFQIPNFAIKEYSLLCQVSTSHSLIAFFVSIVLFHSSVLFFFFALRRWRRGRFIVIYIFIWRAHRISKCQLKMTGKLSQSS